MVTIQIGNDSRSLEDADESWMIQQVNNRQREELPFCIRVSIQTSTLQISLTTPGCGPGTGGRKPRPDEAEVIQLWERQKLTSDDFSGGNLVAFVKQLRRHL
jgi:hypothetical protein